MADERDDEQTSGPDEDVDVDVESTIDADPNWLQEVTSAAKAARAAAADVTGRTPADHAGHDDVETTIDADDDLMDVVRNEIAARDAQPRSGDSPGSLDDDPLFADDIAAAGAGSPDTFHGTAVHSSGPVTTPRQEPHEPERFTDSDDLDFDLSDVSPTSQRTAAPASDGPNLPPPAPAGGALPPPQAATGGPPATDTSQRWQPPPRLKSPAVGRTAFVQQQTATPNFRRRRVVAVLGVLAVIIVAVGGWLMLSDDDGDSGDSPVPPASSDTETNDTVATEGTGG